MTNKNKSGEMSGREVVEEAKYWLKRYKTKPGEGVVSDSELAHDAMRLIPKFIAIAEKSLEDEKVTAQLIVDLQNVYEELNDYKSRTCFNCSLFDECSIADTWGQIAVIDDNYQHIDLNCNKWEKKK